jgi:hypothetical protein
MKCRSWGRRGGRRVGGAGEVRSSGGGIWDCLRARSGVIAAPLRVLSDEARQVQRCKVDLAHIQGTTSISSKKIWSAIVRLQNY